MRVEFEYERHGTLAYFDAYDVHYARLIGNIAPAYVHGHFANGETPEEPDLACLTAGR